MSGGRAAWRLGGLAAYLAILGAVAGGLLWLYRGARERLDDALGDRLVAIAGTAAQFVEGDSLLAWSAAPDEPLDLLWLASRLAQVRRDHDLSEITVCAFDGRVIACAAGRVPRGSVNAFWELDRAPVVAAQAGIASASRLYRAGGLYQKSAHAPVYDAGGSVTGILTVDGAADFFDALATLRRGAFATAAAVLLFLTAMGWLLWRLQAGMDRARAAAWRAQELAAMGRMTAGIAHEIRNPLSIIRGAAQHLSARLRGAGVEDELAEMIPGEVDRLDRILAGYLAFGRGDAVEMEPVDLDHLARRTVKLVEAELGRAGVRVAVEATGELPRLLADPRRLQQALLNLLLNARDATPAGGVVTVRLARDGDDALLEVLDEGPGLGGADPASLFAPFTTTKEKGSGLGLAVVRQVAEAHGGRATLRDRDGGAGATAAIRLPLPRGD